MIALIVHLSYLVDSYLCIFVKRVVLVCELKWIANSRRLSNFYLIFVFVHSHSIECAITAVAKYPQLNSALFSCEIFLLALKRSLHFNIVQRIHIFQCAKFKRWFDVDSIHLLDTIFCLKNWMKGKIIIAVMHLYHISAQSNDISNGFSWNCFFLLLCHCRRLMQKKHCFSDNGVHE